eukprot:7991-Prymnesium_polylepis.1
MRPSPAYQSLTTSSPEGFSRLIRRTCTWASRARFDVSRASNTVPLTPPEELHEASEGRRARKPNTSSPLPA